MTKIKLKKARKEIDKLDNKIFLLIKKRTKIVKYMLSQKQYKNQIVDHRRIKEIFQKLRKKSLRNKIDPRITHKIWKSMIWSYVDYQRRNFKRK